MGYAEFNTILIVDDNKVNLKIMSKLLETEDYQIIEATSGKEALAILELDKPDLILMDIMMPVMDGYELCKMIKNNYDTKDIPVIFITAKAEKKDLIKGFAVGGVDYVSKPFSVEELKMRVSNHVKLKKSIDKLNKMNMELTIANETIKLQNNQMMEVLAKLEYTSQTDPLTGLYNRRYMNERINDESVRYNRSKKLFSVVISDIDFFKQVNDRFGHDCGDQVLKKISSLIRAAIRKQDYIARWGGEEFLLLLPETNLEGAIILAENLRRQVEEAVFQYNAHELKITMTFGLTEYDPEAGIDAMIIKADNFLYKGKQEGRNRVCAN